LEIAQAVAYHSSNRQKFKVVSKDGDIVDPSGTITGGYINDRNQLLPKVKDLLNLKHAIRAEEEKNVKLVKEIKAKEEEANYHS
jgi:chromosome segregation ATPase